MQALVPQNSAAMSKKQDPLEKFVSTLQFINERKYFKM